MKDIIPAKKESPILGLSGLGGGVGGNLVAGLPEEPKYIEEVFSTYLYSGNSTARSIDNGVNLSKGGMTWIKSRNNTIDNFLTDTEQGTSKRIRSNSGQAAATGLTDTLTSFNDNGFSLGTDGLWEVNHSSYTYSSWSFRKAKGFFDVVKYNGSDTGDGLI